MDSVQIKSTGIGIDAHESLSVKGRSLTGSLVKKSLFIVIFLIAWQLLPTENIVNPQFVPPLSDVVVALAGMIASGELLTNFLASFQRVFFGFGLALAVGIPLGLFMGRYKLFEELVDPLLQLFRNVSSLAIYPVFILILGLGDLSKVAVLFMAAIWPILLNTIAGVKNVDPLLIKSARSMGLSDFAIFKNVVIPSAIPMIASGIRLSASIAIVVLVAAEMIGANSGLGFLIINAQYDFMVPKMYAAIVTLMVIGFIVNYGLVWMETKATSWKEEI
jgi:NitT/TauT family transport system permease protein